MIITEQIPQNLRILVADDDPQILNLFRQVLLSKKSSASLSFDLVTCRNGESAVDAVKKSLEESQPFSVAFIDVRMPPGRSGIWAAEQIRRLDKNVEMFIMTGYSDEHPRDISFRVPPFQKLLYVQKPIHIHEIYQFASALSMKWRAECELQKLNKNLEQCVEERIKEFKTINKELQAKIVELEEVQSALRESEAKYRRLFESLVDVFYQTDSSGRITMVSPSITKAAGYKPEEVIGSYLKDYYVNPNERDKFLEVISTNGFVKDFEVQMKKKDGSVLWASVSVGLSKDQEGNVVGVEGIARDITKRINAEEELRKTKERFRNLTETTSDWIWEVDKDVCYTYVSPKISDILGYDPEEIIGKTPFDLMARDEADRVFRIFNNIYASQKPFDCLENINIHKYSHPVVIETSGVPIFGLDGKFSGYRGVNRDITERKEIEETLRQSEMRYRTLAENSMIGIWQINLDGYNLYINPAMCEMLEIKDHGELNGRTFYSFFDRENREVVKRELSKHKKGRSSTYQVEIIGENGTKRNLMICGAPLYSSEGKIHSSIATCTDITRLKRIEKSLKEARDELENKVYERTVKLENALEELKRDEEQLTESKLALELLNKELVETNQAISVLARNIDRKKEELEKKIYDICTDKLIPILKNLQKDVHCQKRRADLELILNYLNEIVHEMPLTHNISSCLTVQEMRVAMLLKNGLTSQQIVDLLCISLNTVKTHRRNIRKKLNIENKGINLVSYLKSKLHLDSI